MPVKEKVIPGEVYLVPAPAATNKVSNDGSVESLMESRAMAKKQVDALNVINPASVQFQDQLTKMTEGVHILEALRSYRYNPHLKALGISEALWVLVYFILRWYVLRSLQSPWVRISIRLFFIVVFLAVTFVVIPYFVMGSGFIDTIVQSIHLIWKLIEKQ